MSNNSKVSKNSFHPPQDAWKVLLDQQDFWIEQICKTYTPYPLCEKRKDMNTAYSEFSRGIFFLKEYLRQNHKSLNKQDRIEIIRRIEQQSALLDARENFLKRARERVIR